MSKRNFKAIDINSKIQEEKEYIVDSDYCLYRLFTDSNGKQEELIIDFKNSLELKPTTWMPVTLHWGISIQEVDYCTDELGCECRTNFFVETGEKFKRLNKQLWFKYIQSWIKRELIRMEQSKIKLQKHIQ